MNEVVGSLRLRPELRLEKLAVAALVEVDDLGEEHVAEVADVCREIALLDQARADDELVVHDRGLGERRVLEELDRDALASEEEVADEHFVEEWGGAILLKSFLKEFGGRGGDDVWIDVVFGEMLVEKSSIILVEEREAEVRPLAANDWLERRQRVRDLPLARNHSAHVCRRAHGIMKVEWFTRRITKLLSANFEFFGKEVCGRHDSFLMRWLIRNALEDGFSCV